MSTIVGRIVGPLIDFIYPALCIHCEQRLPLTERHVCPTCWNLLDSIMSGDQLVSGQRQRFDEVGCVSRFVCCFSYDENGPLNEIIHGLKYGQRRSLGVELGKILGERIMSDPALRVVSILVPVPLHRVKLRERGYNQSDFIAKGVAEVTGQTVRSDLLIRKRNTESQTKLSMNERGVNVSDAFAAAEGRKADLHGQAVILIDDIVTTGATMSECARALKEAGAAEVHAAAVALAS